MENFIRSLKADSTLRMIKRGHNVFFQGEIPKSVMILRDGIVRAYTITSSGEERIVALFGKGDIFPISWALGETSTTLFYYEALTDIRVMQVSKDVFTRTIAENSEHMSDVLRFLANQYTSLLLRITGLEQSRAVEKIGFTLYYLLFRYGIEKSEGIYQVDLKLSQITIANLVGLTRESTTKNLKVLKEKNIISYENSTYLVNKEKLEKYLGEDSFRDMAV